MPELLHLPTRPAAPSRESSASSSSNSTSSCSTVGTLLNPSSESAAHLFSQQPDDLARLIGSLLSALIEYNDACPSSSGKGPLTRFHAQKIPQLQGGLAGYLCRLVKFLPSRKDALFLCIVYIRRIALRAANSESADNSPVHSRKSSLNWKLPAKGELRNGSDFPVGQQENEEKGRLEGILKKSSSISSILSNSPELKIKELNTFKSVPSPDRSVRKHKRPFVNSWTIHRLVLGSLIIASKFISDAFIPQSRAAKAGGVSTSELLALEGEILLQLNFNLLWTTDEFDLLVELLCSKMDEGENSSDGPKGEGFDVASFLSSRILPPGVLTVDNSVHAN